eukprot:NODE_1024_length_2573_cov_0.601455.p2 type:complete len:272 gc:universal NODE_1024_length_2573_cov_0.601455:1557-742(-)
MSTKRIISDSDTTENESFSTEESETTKIDTSKQLNRKNKRIKRDKSFELYEDLPRSEWPLKAFCTVKPIPGESFLLQKKKTPVLKAFIPEEQEEIVEQMQIVNGEIVVTDSRAKDIKNLDEKDEFVTEKSFQKKANSRTSWSSNEEIKFFKLLSLLGTDFGLIASALSSKTRIQVRNKYKLEERKNPILVEKCLTRRDFIETKEFAKMCGCDVEEIEKYKGVDIEVPEPYYKVAETLTSDKKVAKESKPKKEKPSSEEELEVLGNVEYSSD